MAEKLTAADLHKMTDEQLVHELREAQDLLFRQRIQSATEKPNVSLLRSLKKTIAQVKTIQREREIAAGGTPASSAASADAPATETAPAS